MQSLSWRVNVLKRRWLKAIVHKLPEGEIMKRKEEEISALKDKIKLMNISKSVETSKEEVKASRLKINEYVLEIDKCIALLNK